jgi:hypothetical protein
MTRSTPPAPPQSNIPIDVKEVSPESESCPKPQSPEFHSDLRKSHWTARAGQGRSRTRIPCRWARWCAHYGGGDEADSSMPARTIIAAPSMMAMSATLKIPVRTEPSPTLMKSTTLPKARRSRRFEAPPATHRANPRRAGLDHRRRIAITVRASNTTAFPIPKSVVRTQNGQSAPRLKNAPAFSAYSSLTVSARNDRFAVPASIVAAMCLVARSHAIVEAIATISTTRRPSLFIIDLFRTGRERPASIRMNRTHAGFRS